MYTKNAVFVSGMAGLLCTLPAVASIIPEVEPNSTKATATMALGLLPGDILRGNSIASTTSGRDFWHVGTAAATLGIYRHQLALTSNTPGHTGMIIGLGQSNSVINTVDTIVQSSDWWAPAPPPRMVQWYGFGKREELYYRVSGTSATTADYDANYSMSSVTPVSGPTGLPEGSLTITTVGNTPGSTMNTDMWVYDSNFNAIADFGNDNVGDFGTGNYADYLSTLTRTYAPGTYYLAISGSSNLANNLASPANGPSDDARRNGAVLDFANIVAAGSANAPHAYSVWIGGTEVALADTSPLDVQFVEFEVVPEPASLVLLVLGGLIARRSAR